MNQKPKILVLGATGMLGYGIGNYFLSTCPEFDVILSYRDDKLAYGPNKLHFDLDKIKNLWFLPECDYIINCIGIIKQVKDIDDTKLELINSTFPIKLANFCEKTNTKLIHISTDCIFSGAKGNYIETDEPDYDDLYGKSKYLGEPKNCMVIRSSFIGEELRGNLSLLEWTKSQKNKKVFGYTNHYWSGLSSKECGKAIETIIKNDLYVPDVRHIYSDIVSKYYMINSFNKKYNLNIDLIPIEAEKQINRTLSTKYDLNLNLNIASFDQMIGKL